MVIVARAVYEKGVLYLTEELDLPENKDVLLTIQPLSDADEAGQETLADVLGYDPADAEALRRSGKKRRQALLKMARSTKTSSAPPHDDAREHDKYLYADPND